MVRRFGCAALGIGSWTGDTAAGADFLQAVKTIYTDAWLVPVGVTDDSATATACTISAHCIGDSFKIIQRGDADVMICGGTEACITLGTVKAWEAIRVMADDTCRPFSKGRRGLVGTLWSYAHQDPV